MTSPAQNIALLLFLRNEAQEAAAKPLAARGRCDNRGIYRQLNHHTRQQARLSGLPLLVVKGRQQTGRTFGERLANAFEYAFSQGYERVIAFGNDCLALDAARLKEAAHRFGQSEVILGPAKDGGVYLLGLSRRAYHRRLFCGLPWQTDELFEALCAYSHLRDNIPLLLDEEEDADDAVSFQRLLGLLPFYSRLRRVLEKILALQAAIPRAALLPACAGQCHTAMKRGPPA